MTLFLLYSRSCAQHMITKATQITGGPCKAMTKIASVGISRSPASQIQSLALMFRKGSCLSTMSFLEIAQILPLSPPPHRKKTNLSALRGNHRTTTTRDGGGGDVDMPLTPRRKTSCDRQTRSTSSSRIPLTSSRCVRCRSRSEELRRPRRGSVQNPPSRPGRHPTRPWPPAC